MEKKSINAERTKDLLINTLLIASLFLAGFYILRTDRSDTAQTPLKSDYKVAAVDQIEARDLPVYNEANPINANDTDTSRSNQAALNKASADILPSSTAQPEVTKSGSTDQDDTATNTRYLFNLLDLRSLKLL